MFPIEIPVGTTVETLFTKVAVETHERLVTSTSTEEHKAVARIENGPSYTVTVRGKQMSVEEGEAPGVPLWMITSRRAVEAFLADWTGPKRFVPKAMPKGVPLVLLSDPRVLKRIAQVSGKLELAIDDFEGGRVSMTVAFGDAAKKGISSARPDASISVASALIEKVLSGAVAPEQVLAENSVRIEGNRFIAMQLAFALAPFFPAQK